MSKNVKQIADELGVSRQAISKWESAVSYPEMDKIIARLFREKKKKKY